MLKEKKKILVVDDNPAILDVLMIMLEEVGYEVETTVDGSSLLTMKSNLPDLLLLDIWMSGVDGGDVCKVLKSYATTQHIPVIMISANKDIKQIAHECGANDYIAKPFQMENLLTIVAKYVNKH